MVCFFFGYLLSLKRFCFLFSRFFGCFLCHLRMITRLVPLEHLVLLMFAFLHLIDLVFFNIAQYFIWKRWGTTWSILMGVNYLWGFIPYSLKHSHLEFSYRLIFHSVLSCQQIKTFVSLYFIFLWPNLSSRGWEKINRFIFPLLKKTSFLHTRQIKFA